MPSDDSPLHQALLRAGDIEERFWTAVPDHLSDFGAKSLRRAAKHKNWKCRETSTNLPIDLLLLLHPTANYLRDRVENRDAHSVRVRTESLLGEDDPRNVDALYAAMADAGLGRPITAFPASENPT